MSSERRGQFPVIWIAGLLAMDVAAYLFEKIACRNAAGMPGEYFGALVHQPLLWASLALSPLQFWVWTTILSRADLSLAYPISGLNYPLTVLAAVVLLGETLSWPVWVGIGLITAGIFIIGPERRDSPAPPCPAAGQ
jgi:drug/metabolite transporter (DMT)-like permease